MLCRRGDWNEELGKFVQYRAGFLLECIILSFNLRSAGALQTSLRQALRLLPSVWRGSLKAMVESGTATISEATASRARLCVDAAFMIMNRRRHAKLLAAD
eukprot:7623551-Pyramimonas_sp.AAC.1